MGRVWRVWIVTVVLAGGCMRVGYDEPRAGDGPVPTVDAPLQHDQQVDGPQRVDAFPQDSPADAPTTGWVTVNHNLTTSTLNGVWTDSPSRVYVVGNAGIVLFFDGAAWSKLSTPQLTADLHAVWGAKTSSSGPVTLYMVGATQYVWRLEGKNWIDSLNAPGPAFFDVWGGPAITDLWVVGANATVLRGLLPDTMTQQAHTCTADHLRTVIGGGQKIWFAGERGKVCYHKSSIQELDHNLTTEALNAAWFDSTSGSVWFAGDNHTVLRVDSGGIASLVPAQGNGHLRGIWGCSGSDIWAVGGKGKILHYNGKTWSHVASPTTELLYAVWGSSPTDVWAVGAGGTVIRYLGSQP